MNPTLLLVNFKMADDREEDGEALCQGELEDGEVLSSDEEETGGEETKSKLTPEEKPQAQENTEVTEPASAGTKRPAPEDAAAGAIPEEKVGA